MPRTIKLGRKPVAWPFAVHWAVKVGDTWYEIAKVGNVNVVNTNCGEMASSSAGALGGEIVGETDKTDSQIVQFIESWKNNNPRYNVFEDNCQKFAYEFIFFLCNGVNFRLPHRFDAALSAQSLKMSGQTFAIAEDGYAVARLGGGEARASAGYFNSMYRAPTYEAAAVAGPGLGAWVGASPAGRAEVNLGPLVGAHIEPNINTGVGIRDGNLDVHVLGFGTRIGADGVEINTPLGGVNACTIS